MIIDSRAHVVVPNESCKYMAELVVSRANPTYPPSSPDESVRKADQTRIGLFVDPLDRKILEKQY